MAHPRDPNQPLPNAKHEAYARARATGLGSAEAAEAVGLKAYRAVERRATLRERVRALEAERAPIDATLTLQELIKACKRVLSGALASKQFRHANDALERLVALYERYPQLRTDSPAPAPAGPAAELSAGMPKLSRLERRMAHRAALSAVPAAERV